MADAQEDEELEILKRNPKLRIIQVSVPNSSKEFVQTLQNEIRKLKPSKKTTHGKKSVFVSKELSNCSHVFVYNNATVSSLHPVYLGPFVVKKAPKYFDIEIKGIVKRISIDRLKLCFTLHENSEQSKTDASSTATMDPPPTPCPNKSDELLPKGESYTTRKGRKVKFPKHLEHYVP
ncbi:hypothetical protein JTE90_007437 [Oedothorax gibbosus]|uniref:Uncharacterized protein n=1 Tax=Oedothorax gibbosus TaxID=931172 RepID=A0AAV6UP69_9ARAC|nr:hypothetical protein JTE90_007437 [Oedothorax gibbosus]